MNEEMKTYRIGNVLKNRKTGGKIVIRKDVFVDKEKKYEFVCSSPHDEGDFSYFCGSDYCRCAQ
tara:strand:+ start:3322 stop:3513 length:192 start_codon:yes stop_codon:yes gene_type:complete